MADIAVGTKVAFRCGEHNSFLFDNGEAYPMLPDNSDDFMYKIVAERLHCFYNDSDDCRHSWYMRTY